MILVVQVVEQKGDGEIDSMESPRVPGFFFRVRRGWKHVPERDVRERG